MNTYKIAEVIVNLDSSGKTLMDQGKAYLIEKRESCDISIALKNDFLWRIQREYTHLTMDECEYIWTGFEFYHKLLDFNGFMLHASAVAMENRAYLFSAKSGVGKSTHTGLWQRYFGEDKALIINDDKPAIRFLGNKFYAYGTPWSGKSNKNLDIKVPVNGVIFIERAEKNWIRKLEDREAVKLILEQTVRPKERYKLDKLLNLIDSLTKLVPIYKMGCNISEEAVRLAYDTFKADNYN